MSTSTTIVVTSADLDRLRRVIAQQRERADLTRENEEALVQLERELDKATLVEPTDVDPDVVTMNSTVLLRAEHSGRISRWTVVYPEDANIDENCISVLEPLGTALLGYRVGDEFEWEMPVGLRRYLVEGIVHQPEAAGEFDR